MGYARQLAVHVPLGVGLVLLTLGICASVWRPAAAAARVPRRSAGGAA